MDFNVPNHFIDLGSVKTENIDFEEESDKLRNILDFAQKENDVQQYIKQNKKWFIPAALFRDYDFGHHSAYLVPEQSLGAEYKADYMLLGNNSIGHQIILVEFEDVNVDFKILTANSETASVRKGLTQIRDWKRWMDDHRIYFFDSCGLTEIGNSIPSWGIYYCLVVSRRNRMNEAANQLRRQMQAENPRLHIVTYDRLVDNIRPDLNLLHFLINIWGQMTYINLGFLLVGYMYIIKSLIALTQIVWTHFLILSLEKAILCVSKEYQKSKQQSCRTKYWMNLIKLSAETFVR